MYIKLESTILCTSSLSSYKVFMRLFECVDEHWMLLVADLKWRQFMVYDSLLTKRAPTRTDLQNSGVSSPLLPYVFAPLSRIDTHPLIHD